MSGVGAARSGAAPAVRVVRFAPAKLNLTLAVVSRREDGYHALHSVMVPLALGDRVALSPASRVAAAGDGAAGDTLRVTGLPVAAAPDNLVLRAISATRDAVRGTRPDAAAPALAARLTKRIPVAAGLGGGSSDAATTVAAALEAWGAALPAEAIRTIAASLGSDVPFFLARGVALVTGRGEFVEPLPAIAGETPAVLLVVPSLPVSTPAVFAAYAAGARPSTAAALATSERLAADLRAGLPAAALLARADDLAAANDLLPASLEVAPSLAAFRAALGRLVDRPAGQSGSGPTAWILYPSLAAARRAARLVRAGIRGGSLPKIGEGEPFVAATTILASGLPAGPAGAHNVGRNAVKGR